MPLKWSIKAPMEYSFDRVLAPGSKSGIERIVVAAVVAAMACLATARADDVLDRSAAFHISASPLASALIEFSTQSGLQIAAADADVSQLNAHSVNGTLPVRAALSQLLLGSGLEYSRVGSTTVAIRMASAGPAIGSVASAPPATPDVTVTVPPPPADRELAGDSLHQFVLHHATVHYVNTGVRGNLAHWRGGKQSICPVTQGLDPGYNAFVTARLRALAAYVGAPVQTDPQCNDNVQILFTTKPHETMKNVEKWASFYFRYRYGAIRRLIEYRNDQVINGWYITTSGGATALNADLGLQRLNLAPLWPRITPNWPSDIGDMSGIGVVILVIDTTKVAGYPIGTIADYAAVLTLSVVQSPDHCDALPSILDLMSPSCGSREPPAGVTAADLAFLKALYYRNTGLGSSPSRDAIQDNMLRQFKGS
jgi:hypothetical protein